MRGVEFSTCGVLLVLEEFGISQILDIDGG
jgi:hypothetical protein